MAAILAMMQAQQAQTTAVLRAFQGGNKPSLSFSTWDGQSSTKGLFIERLKVRLISKTPLPHFATKSHKTLQNTKGHTFFVTRKFLEK
jgi:hypothetical protein